MVNARSPAPPQRIHQTWSGDKESGGSQTPVMLGIGMCLLRVVARCATGNSPMQYSTACKVNVCSRAGR